jgi:hypothetical protein
MKKILLFLTLLIIGLFASDVGASLTIESDTGIYLDAEMAPVVDDAIADQVEGFDIDVPPGEASVSFADFILENWGALLFGLLGFIKIIVNLTPSDKDNKVFEFLDKLISFIIPNLKKGGGTHTGK